MLLAAFAVLGAVATLLLPPIPQDPAYHAFADDRRLLGIPNALNVLSNAAFVVAGTLGWRAAWRQAPRPGGAIGEPWERGAFLVLFAGTVLTGLGSAYYHLAPSTPTLFWDRLPMTIVFMALFALVIGERLSPRAGRRLLLPLLLAGVASIVYWHVGEARGAGDLRFYGLVQFLPMVAIPLMLLTLPPRYTRGGDLGIAIGWYALAKVFEFLDGELYALGGLASGHTVKHLLAALALYWIVRMLQKRGAIEG